MHSHSGQFCPGHAVDSLEAVIQRAKALGFTTMGLTEHMPRYDESDLYPEELADAQASLDVLPVRHQAYLTEARRLQAKYAASQLSILIGFEAEFMRPAFAPRVTALAEDPCVDYFIGSVHHVHGLPIDYNSAFYADAVEASGGGEEGLYEDYYDLQYQMLSSLSPRIVGHFDLIRLMSADPARDVSRWAGVWEKIRRNLRLVASQGGWLE
ncbi:hypothetical protein CDD80_7051 [Ophiocordyceps camponoti-rufipedis]|uniref:Histidinol-phosphatase n=1 Tax=Ophiocordyceps camponoti-rufipedis TaxID=2004952 RepID=A0A2C5YPU3_9HYPO|nr:hypothetical protein CDD80_7051 [Ophiocordyceps camponoti-rufipedis]